MAQVLTVSCRIDVPSELRPRVDATLQAFADACNVARQIAETAGISNKIRIHYRCYHQLREQFGLSSNLVIRAIARVAAVLKAQHKNAHFRPTSADYDQRIFRFREKDWSVSLTLLGGAENFRLIIGAYQRRLLTGRKPKSAKLVRRENGTYFVQIALESTPVETEPSTGVLGVDLGIRNLASLSTGERFGGLDVETTRDRYQSTRASLQRKGTKGAKRLLKRLSGREKRYVAWINHTISARIIRFARLHGLTVAIEDLTGIRSRGQVKKDQRNRHHRWAFFQLRRFLEYKALRNGVQVVCVNPAYTSRTCHQCLHIGVRARDSFRCDNCGYSGHADYNGACNVANLGKCVTLPEHSLSCKLAE